MTKNLLLFETALLQADVSIHDLVPMIVRSLRVRIVTELTKAPNFAQR